MKLGAGVVVAVAVIALGSTARAAPPASVLYLNRCVGDCKVTRGADDARAGTSSIPAEQGISVLHEWAWGDAQWNGLVQCVKEIYSPYNISIVTERPGDDVTYNEEMIAGLGAELGHPEFGGVSPDEPCSAPDTNTITFTFANLFGRQPGLDCDATPTAPGCVAQVYDICGVVGQESAHAFGLDHEHTYVATGMPACSSPMTYLQRCGQQFFRGELAFCGEGADRACMCSDPQNAHLRLLSVLGPGTPITAPPVMTVTSPLPDTTLAPGQPVVAVASAQRGVRRVELVINGYKWSEVDGVEFGRTGQPQASYAVPVPAMVPDGVLDLEVTAKDDIGIATTVKLTVTKGAPCTDATTCLTGQRCDDRGRCLWDPAAGQTGDACTYPQFCVSGLCNSIEGGDMLCTQSCVLTASDSCPAGDTCYESGPGQGQCFPTVNDGGGCCSTGHGAAAQTSLLGLALVAMLRRRRR